MDGLMGVVPKGYNGMVDVNGQQLPVRSGQVMFQGQKFQVSEQGMVTLKGQPVGMVQQGKFIPK